MLLPNKHITLAQSIFGLAGIILKFLSIPKDIDELWTDFLNINNTKDFPCEHDYNNFLLAIYYLFTVGIVDLNENNKICLCG